MKANTILRSIGVIVLLSLSLVSQGQVSCDGTINESSMAVYGSYTTIGNGTSGNVRVCLSANTLSGTKCSGTSERIVIRNTAGTIVAQWTSATAVGTTCITMTTNDGYARVSSYCPQGNNATLTWTTVDGGGSNVCHCNNGVQDADETGVDCGGASCSACTVPHCSNGIKDFDETQTDCGGVDCAACTPPANSNSSNSCPGSANSPIYGMTCADVGTANFNSSAGAVTYTGGTATATPTPSCGGGSPTKGTWARYDLQTGVTQVTFNWESSMSWSADAGNHTIYAAIYQGTCGSLTEVACGIAADVNMPSIYFYNIMASGLNASQDLYVYLFDDGGKNYSIALDATGAPSNPANDACGGAISSIDGCNLGATGDMWQGVNNAAPMNEGATCTGGTWYSNENTVWYTAVASSTTASIDIENAICNDGSAGYAQFGVFTSCACPEINLYGGNSCFKGCAGGTGTISLSGLSVGTTYYIAVDGNAGDICKWDFVAPGLILPVSFVDFYAKKEGHVAVLHWSTASESGTDYYEVERSIDGATFLPIGKIDAKGNSSVTSNYVFRDNEVDVNKAYYRLKQYDVDGDFAYSRIIIVSFDGLGKDPLVYVDAAAKNTLTVQFYEKYTTEFDVKIYNMTGQLVFQKNISSADGAGTTSIDISSLRKGVYMVALQNKTTSKVYTTKIAKYSESN